MVSAAHFSFMGICRNTTFEVLYCNLFSGISRWYHYHKSEVNSMKAEKKEINIQIGKRLQTARENSGYTQEVFAETLDVGGRALSQNRKWCLWFTAGENADLV